MSEIEVKEVFKIKDGEVYHDGKKISLEDLVKYINIINELKDKQNQMIVAMKKLAKKDDEIINKFKNGLDAFGESLSEMKLKVKK